jgi:hypothetical protein
MSKRRRTPDLVATVTGAAPAEEKAAPEQAKLRSGGDGGGAGERARPAAEKEKKQQRPSAHGTRGGASQAREADAGGPRWSAEPERSNFTFRLSGEVSDELERLILSLRLDHGVRASRSEIAEVALQLAVEDATRRGEKSDLVKRLSGKLRRRHDRDTGKASSK